MNKFFLFVLILVMQIPAFGQREYGACDSTFYPLNTDTTIIAGKNHIYLQANNTTSVLYHFTSADNNNYIRDFDIVLPNLWYTVIGSRYIGGNTQLYKSTNKGITWLPDTNHYQAKNANLVSVNFLRSINNLQHLGGDTLVMFMHYYESGILYSTDLGSTWTKWFDNLITHYHGMFTCANKYYIYGYAGDGFRPWMFGFDAGLLFTPDSTGQWNSFNNNGYHPPCSTKNDTLNCIYPPNSLSRCDNYAFFKSKIQALCSTVGFKDNPGKAGFGIYPNPVKDHIRIEGLSGTETFMLTNLYGQTIWAGTRIEVQDFKTLASGIYFLTIHSEKGWQTLKLVKE